MDCVTRRGFEFDSAIVRAPAKSVVDGLRAGSHAGPAFEGVETLHRHYVEALREAGVTVEVLPPLEDYPDSIFVEDPAFVLGGTAILLRPGAPSRAGEAEELVPYLKGHFKQVHRLENGYADGGDILVLPDEVLIGLSARTDEAGARAFAAILEKQGVKVRVAEAPAGVLHFKTGCALIDEETVLAIPALAGSGFFTGFDVIATADGEEPVANALRINDKLLVDADFPRTGEILASRGYDLVPLPVAEIRKIDAGLSCMSLRWKEVA
jgi:dimethylargininase